MRRVRDALARALRQLDRRRPARPPSSASLCLAWPDGHEELAEGRVDGPLVRPSRAARFGFGYDPIFVPEGESRTFAEMPRATKDRLSHRSRAVDALLARCFGVVPSAPALARDHD